MVIVAVSAALPIRVAISAAGVVGGLDGDASAVVDDVVVTATADVVAIPVEVGGGNGVFSLFDDTAFEAAITGAVGVGVGVLLRLESALGWSGR